jgi:hypothetical protein
MRHHIALLAVRVAAFPGTGAAAAGRTGPRAHYIRETR